MLILFLSQAIESLTIELKAIPKINIVDALLHLQNMDTGHRYDKETETGMGFGKILKLGYMDTANQLLLLLFLLLLLLYM